MVTNSVFAALPEQNSCLLGINKGMPAYDSDEVFYQCKYSRTDVGDIVMYDHHGIEAALAFFKFIALEVGYLQASGINHSSGNYGFLRKFGKNSIPRSFSQHSFKFGKVYAIASI